MRGAAWLLIASAACSSSPTPSTVVDAGADVREGAAPDASAVALTADDLFVVRGRTALAYVGAPQFVPLTVGLIDLPSGITATPAHTDAWGAASVQVTAAADAPSADVSALAVGYDATGVRGTCPIRVAVMGPEGALDPTFGVGGMEKMPLNANVAGIAPAAGGRLFATLSNAGTHCQLARLDLDGSLDSSFGNGGLVEIAPFTPSYCEGIAADTSGGVGLVVASGTQLTALVQVDANGVVATPVALPSAASIAWTQGSWLLFGNFDNAAGVMSVSTSGQISAPLQLPFSACAGGTVAADGSALAFGYDGYNATAAKAYKLVPQSGAYVIDTSFGASGAADVGPTGLRATAAVSDGQGGFFVGVDSTVVHVGADGKQSGGLSLSVSAITGFAPLPSGDFVALGNHNHELALARFDSQAKLVPTFGAFGISVTSQVLVDQSVTTVYDGTSHLFVADWYLLARFDVAP